MIHVMPDQSVRVTSRFPDGHSIVFFNLEHGDGFTLEQDQYRSEIAVLRMMGCYSSCAARYGEPTEAAADFADLATMLADRHCSPPPTLLPVQPAHASLLPPVSSSSGAAKRKGWGWKGVVAGLAIGAIGAHFAPNWRTADTSAVHATALGDTLLRPGSRGDDDLIPPFRPLIPSPPALPPNPAAPPRLQPSPRPPTSAPSFGLQQ